MFYWDPHGTTPLHVACKYGHDVIVKILLNNHVYQWDRYGTTPLHIACQYGHDSIVKILLEYLGPGLCQKKYLFDRNGTTPLHVACQYGHVGIVNHFLEHRNPIIYKSIINQCDRNGTIPLHVACQYGYDSIVELLLSKGANINQLDLKKRTPQCVAIETGHGNIVELLKNNKSKDASYWYKRSLLRIKAKKMLQRFIEKLLIHDKYGTKQFFLNKFMDEIHTTEWTSLPLIITNLILPSMYNLCGIHFALLL